MSLRPQRQAHVDPGPSLPAGTMKTPYSGTQHIGETSPERGGIQLEVTQPVSGSGESHDSAPLASKLLLSPDTAQPEPDEDGLVQD